MPEHILATATNQPTQPAACNHDYKPAESVWVIVKGQPFHDAKALECRVCGLWLVLAEREG